jgi:DNA transformation protein
MAVSDEFLEYIVDLLSCVGHVTAHRMFGGAGLYCEGVIFGVVADDTAYLKVDDSNRQDFVKAGSSPFDPYPEKARGTTYGYYEIPLDVLESPVELAQWAGRSLQIARTKKKKGRP